MNKENAHLFLPLVQALAEGKTVQWKSDDGLWGDIDEIEFCMYDNPSDYRIKPEPRTWEIYLDPNGHIIGEHLEGNSKRLNNHCQRITVQEVLE